MSDVGLGANLELDITAALRRVDQLGRALDAASGITIAVDTSGVAPEISRAVAAADSGVVVEADTSDVAPEISRAVEAADSGIVVDADTSDVAGSITAAVDAADTGVTVEADATDVTGSIDAAVEAADAAVVITADAADVTGSIDGAIQAADTNVVVTGDSGALRSQVQDALQNQGSFGPISVDGQVDPNLAADIGNLGANLADASDEGKALSQIIGLLSVGAAAAGIKALAESASDLAESTSKARVVFGTEFPQIEQFAVDAAGAVGLSNQAALEATATFGNLFQALGTSRAEAAALSPEVVQLAGDLASFNNLGVDETLEKLRSGLVGEIEPLRSLGVSFNAAQVDAKALELGLGGVGRELTEGEKVQARYALIVEQTALAQGDFARTADGLANQQRILSAELQNTAAAAGTALLPAIMALLDEVRQVVPELGSVAADVLPAVSDALINLAPLLGVTVDLLVALAPAIEIVANLLAAIPDEAIAVGAGLLIANKAFGGLGAALSGSIGALQLVPSILRGTASAVPAATSGVGGLASGITGLATSVAGLNPLVLAGGVLAVGLFSAWQKGQEEARRYREELNQLGSSLETLDGFQQLTTSGVAKYIETQSRINAKDQIDDLGKLGITFQQIAGYAQQGAQGQLQFVDALVRGGDLTRVTRNEYGELVTATGEIIDANSDLGRSLEDVGFGQLVVGNTDLVKSYEEIAQVTDDVAKRQIESLQAQGLLTDGQVREALALNDSGEAARSYAEALNRLEPQIVAAERAARIALATYGPLADQFVDTGAALQRVDEAAPDVGAKIAALRTGAQPTDRAFLGLATSLQTAALSEEDFADAAALLGTDVKSLQTFVDGANQAVDDFASTASQALPTVSDAFRNVGDDSKLSVQEFREGLESEAEAMRDFTFRLAALTQAGFGELAGVIAQEGPEIGGLLAAELTTALAKGDTQLLEQTQASLDTFQGSWADSTAYLRDTLGPEFVLTTGLIGSAATTAFGENLDFGERLRIAGEVAALQMDESGKAVAAIAATEGADAARQYGLALKLPEETIEAAVAAGAAIKANAPTDEARDAGRSTGEAFADGVTEGISNRQGSVNDRSQQLVLQARAAAARASEEGSPSKLFRSLGENMALGVVVGLDAAGSQVVAAAERIVREAATGVASVAPEVALAAMSGGGAGPASSGGQVVFQFDITVNPPAGMTPQEARAIGSEIADGAAERVAERQLAILSRTQ